MLFQVDNKLDYCLLLLFLPMAWCHFLISVNFFRLHFLIHYLTLSLSFSILLSATVSFSLLDLNLLLVFTILVGCGTTKSVLSIVPPMTSPWCLNLMQSFCKTEPVIPASGISDKTLLNSAADLVRMSLFCLWGLYRLSSDCARKIWSNFWGNVLNCYLLFVAYCFALIWRPDRKQCCLFLNAPHLYGLLPFYLP